MPVVNLLRAFRPIVCGCFGDQLDPNYDQLIENFRDEFLRTQEIIQAHPSGARLSVTWKVHVCIVHLPQFLSRHKVGMSRFSEQCGEAVHHAMKPILSRFLVGEDHSQHAEKLKRAVVEFSTERV